MNPYQAEKIVTQYDADLRTLSARSGHTSQAQRARWARQARAHRGHRQLIRRRAGWALVSLGLRLAYEAED